MKKVFLIIIALIFSLILMVITINFYVVIFTKNQIINNGNDLNLDNIDCILVLGAGVWGDRPSPLLEDRLKTAIELYESGVANKIIMSGDHDRKDYDEVNIMREYAINNGIPSEDIFMDHAGFSTYESIYRAKKIFEVQKIIIVTQKYHLYRALYIANQLRIEAHGIAAEPRKYSGAIYREAREVLARNKDFVQCMFEPRPNYLGDTIPINGNGNITNDK